MKIEKNSPKLYVNTDNNLYKLKKILSIIHKYSVNNKRILFVGSFNKSLKTSLRGTKHIEIPGSVWVSGILTNPSACFKYLIKNHQNTGGKEMQSMVSSKKRIDLIIIMGIDSASNIINESYIAQIPVISCDSLTVIENNKYEIPKNLKFIDKQKNNNFICAMIIATIAKSKMSENKKKPKFYKIEKLF